MRGDSEKAGLSPPCILFQSLQSGTVLWMTWAETGVSQSLPDALLSCLHFYLEEAQGDQVMVMKYLSHETRLVLSWQGH